MKPDLDDVEREVVKQPLSQLCQVPGEDEER